MYEPLSFQDYREHLFTKCGFMRNTHGSKIHRAYTSHCDFMRHMAAKYPNH